MEAGIRVAHLIMTAALTAVIAYDDMIALGLMALLPQRGIRPGVDISVIGIDDRPLASVSYPPLSSIRFPGAAAVDVLLDLIDEVQPSEPSVVELETSPIVRGSTGPLPN